MFARFRLRLAAAWSLPALAYCIGLPSAYALVADAGWSEGSQSGRPAALSAPAENRAESMARVATGFLASEDDPDKSFREYRSALNIDPGNVSLAEEISRVHLQREEIPEALAVL
jgi:hypothetical protein